MARIGTVRLRHSRLSCIAFSPDGKVLASGGYDHAIRFWDPVTGQELRSLAGHQQLIYAIAFSRDGKFLASGGWDTEVIVWRTDTGTEMRRLTGPQQAVTSLSFSPDGRWVVAGDKENTVHVWDAGNGKEVHCFQGEQDATASVSAVAFSPDGKTLAVARTDRGIELWDVASWKLAGHLKATSSGSVFWLFLPTVRRCFPAPTTGPFAFWNVAENREVQRVGTARENRDYDDQVIQSLAVAPDGKSVVTARMDGWISVPDTASGKELRRWNGDPNGVEGLAFSRDGRTLASASRHAIRLWDPQTGKRLDPIIEPAIAPKEIIFSADGKHLIVNNGGQAVLVLDAASRKERLSVELKAMSLCSLAISPDSRAALAFVDAPYFDKPRDSRIRRIDLVTGKEKDALIRQFGVVEHIAYSAGETPSSVGAGERSFVGTGQRARNGRAGVQPRRNRQRLPLRPMVDF